MNTLLLGTESVVIARGRAQGGKEFQFCKMNGKQLYEYIPPLNCTLKHKTVHWYILCHMHFIIIYQKKKKRSEKTLASPRPFQRVHKIETIFIMIIKHYFHCLVISNDGAETVVGPILVPQYKSRQCHQPGLSIIAFLPHLPPPGEREKGMEGRQGRERKEETKEGKAEVGREEGRRKAKQFNLRMKQ